MSTCGECKSYQHNSCFCLEAAPSLLDMFYATTPACEYFERRTEQPAPAPISVPVPDHKPPANPLDMLSPETRDKMARQDRQTHRGALPRRYWPDPQD